MHFDIPLHPLHLNVVLWSGWCSSIREAASRVEESQKTMLRLRGLWGRLFLHWCRISSINSSTCVASGSKALESLEAFALVLVVLVVLIHVHRGSMYRDSSTNQLRTTCGFRGGDKGRSKQECFFCADQAESKSGAIAVAMARKCTGSVDA